MSKDYFENLPKKRMAAGALIFNNEDEVMIVKPSYKDYWSIPGGMIEENESPRRACMREVKEEVGIEIKSLKFVCVDYTKAELDKNESLQFIFYGGKINNEMIYQIKIDEEEIVEYKFISPYETEGILGGPSRGLARRLPACLEAIKSNKGIYLEDGRE